jgi:hypothetical protein
MSWIAIAGAERSWTCGVRLGPTVADATLMLRGTLMVEARLTATGRVQRLIHCERRMPWPASLSLTAVPGEGLALVIAQGDRVFQSVLAVPAEMREDTLRISFAWDSRAGLGRFAVERADGTVLAMKSTDAPPPLMHGDLRALVATGGANQDNVLFRAVSTEIEPLGPVPSLSGDIQVATPHGPRRVADLQCGDTVTTPSGEIVPVLARVTRRVPALGAFQTVRLCAPYFGLQCDLLVAPGQCLVIGGADVAYLFGCEAVLVPACSLVNGVAARFEDTGPIAEWHHLLLPGHETLCATGAQLESLYVGRLRRRRDLVRETVLADVPTGLMPEHAGTSLKVLKPFEAVTLAQTRAA